MDCRACSAALSAVLDEEADSREVEAVHAHLRACDSCQRRWMRLREAREAFRALPPDRPGAAFEKRVLAALTPRGRRWLRLTLAGAAAALVVAVLYSSIRDGDVSPRSPSTRALKVEPPASGLAGLEAGRDDIACVSADAARGGCGPTVPCASRDSCGATMPAEGL
jgi:predicted anti-sigma-YlaC factor YlaD